VLFFNSHMTYSEFLESLKHEAPPDASPLLESLWHDAKGNWNRAHELIQDMETKDGALIHAYLHRKEGDSGNAAYWYNRAGQRPPALSLENEWKELAHRFTDKTR
jgi:hypothetical protein